LDVDGRWGRTDSPLAPHQPPVRARATCEANGAGAAARHMQGRHRTRERGGLSSGSQLTCTFFLRGIYLERGFQCFFLHRSALLLLMLALVELFRSLSVGFLFCFYIIIIIIFWLWDGFHFVF
jgi:hypothetical protein